MPGDVQWMTAGRGLIHNEIPAEGVTVHSLQLWVNLPAAVKMTGPRYQDLAGDAVPWGDNQVCWFGLSSKLASAGQRRAVGGAVRRAEPHGSGVRRTDNRAVVTPPTVLADSATLFHSTELRLPVRTLKSVFFPSRQKRMSNRRRPNRRSVSVTSGGQSGSADRHMPRGAAPPAAA